MEEKKPHSCSVVLSTNCMLRCKMCRMWDSKKEEGLFFKDLSPTILSLKDILGEPKKIVLSGGEPFMRKDIFEIIKCASENGLRTLVPSNGYLINDDIARKIADSGLGEVFISLDGVNPATHDLLRGVEGAFSRVQNAFEMIKKYSPKTGVGIICVISGVNYREIADLAAWVKQGGFLSGVYFQVIAKPFYVPLDDDWYLREEFGFLWPKDTGEVIKYIEELIAMKKNGFLIHNDIGQLELFKHYFLFPGIRPEGVICNLGANIINIDQKGDIAPCCFMEAIGNIKNKSISDIWFSEKGRRARSAMRACQKNCNNIVNCVFKE